MSQTKSTKYFIFEIEDLTGKKFYELYEKVCVDEVTKYHPALPVYKHPKLLKKPIIDSPSEYILRRVNDCLGMKSKEEAFLKAAVLGISEDDIEFQSNIL